MRTNLATKTTKASKAAGNLNDSAIMADNSMMNSDVRGGKMPTNPIDICQQNIDRYRYGLDRGHRDYIETARLNENFYLGGGLQWTEEDTVYLEDLGRSPIEMNTIFPAVNTAIGFQLQARAGIAYKPRGGDADQPTAEVLTKVAMQITNDIKYQWLESQLFADGLIQQRGFLDFRIGFDDNMFGSVIAQDLDPMDVIIDPDAQSYDPCRWQDVTVVRWMTVDDIEQLFGEEKANEVARELGDGSDSTMDVDYGDRSHFGGKPRDLYADTWTDDRGTRRILVIERQHRRLLKAKVLVSPLGDVVVDDLLTAAQRANLLSQGYFQTTRVIRRIRWTITSRFVVLHDKWSPYKTFTIIPYFPYFRRGQTRGMVDNLRSMQEAANKSFSQIQHILNSTANGGFFVEEKSLTNMTTQDLEDFGSRTGLVVEYKKDPHQD